MRGPLLIARFPSEARLTEAVRRLRKGAFGPISIHSPHPVEIAEDGAPRVWHTVPMIALLAGLAGFVASLSLQLYADVWSYPLNIGGRPLNSWPAYIPTAFENGILGSVLAGFVCFMVAMARDDLSPFVAIPIEAAMLDSYSLALRPRDGGALERAHTVLREARAERTIEVPS